MYPQSILRGNENAPSLIGRGTARHHRCAPEFHTTLRELSRLAAAAQVGLDQKPGIVLHQRAIDLHIFEHALYVIACLGNRYALDPIDRINPRIARVAVLLDPLARAPWAGIIGNESQDV